ncbi:DUF2442 domain-containing protein [candidate division KSB1 bacterium]|nr:DUF2442 domain-containing protein [candidate division KSB1 bacterium]
MHGEIISTMEVTNISIHGFWLYINGKEYFLPFADFPWFKNAKVSDIFDVELLHKKHLYWKKLDVDLDLKSIENPDLYPMVYK